MKCIKCDTDITLNIATAMDEEGETFRCPHCGFIFRYTEK